MVPPIFGIRPSPCGIVAPMEKKKRKKKKKKEKRKKKKRTTLFLAEINDSVPRRLDGLFMPHKIILIQNCQGLSLK